MNNNKHDDEYKTIEMEEIAISRITVDAQLHFPDFDEDYDRALKESWKEVYAARKRIKIYDSILLATWALVIPCLLGLLVNDSFQGCEIYKTEIKTTIGK